MPDVSEAISVARDCPYGNGASIFTNDGYAARQFKMHFNAGMIGINIGVPAPMAWFPFTGWNKSFFGDLHIQGIEGVHFYTRQKTTMTRWFANLWKRLPPRSGGGGNKSSKEIVHEGHEGKDKPCNTQHSTLNFELQG